MRKIIYSIAIMAAMFVVASSCKQDPFDDIQSHERAVEEVFVGGDFTQVGPAIVDRAALKATVRVLVEDNTDFSKVPINVMSSYKSKTNPAPGTIIDFKGNNNQYTFTVTSEAGETRDWTIELVPFTEAILGTYTIQNLIVFGGTGPEYGGGAVLKMTDKSWVWPVVNGPAVELDNTLTFEFTGVTDDGKTYGTLTNAAGEDGAYANFLFVNPEMDLNHFYRTIPKGISTWQHDYTTNSIIFIAADGTTTSGSFKGASTIDLGNGLSKTISDNAFDFSVGGKDDWDNFGTDLDKFATHPRRYWIDVKRK